MRNSPRAIEDQALKTGETVRLRARDATDQSLARRVLPGKFQVSLYDIYIRIYIYIRVYIYIYVYQEYVYHSCYMEVSKVMGYPQIIHVMDEHFRSW